MDMFCDLSSLVSLVGPQHPADYLMRLAIFSFFLNLWGCVMHGAAIIPVDALPCFLLLFLSLPWFVLADLSLVLPFMVFMSRRVAFMRMDSRLLYTGVCVATLKLRFRLRFKVPTYD